MEILKQFNWVDIFVAILLFRICYISLKSGFVIEFFKLLGTIVAIYLSLHYYISLSSFIRGVAGLEFIPDSLFEVFWFCILASAGYMVFMFIRESVGRFIKTETIATLNKWGGLLLGIGRGFLLSGLILFIFAISPIRYFAQSTKRSYSGRHLVSVAPDMYRSLWYGVMSKFMTEEKLNKAVAGVEKELQK